jgi:Uma2 family endonuclease
MGMIEAEGLTMQPTASAAHDIDEPPDHLQLPDTDGKPVNNDQEHPLSNMLASSVRPHLEARHPDGQFIICCDVGIYWKHTKPQPLDGCRAPDFFLVIGVPPLLDGIPRRSYVMWREAVTPTLLIEYVSGDGSEERDRTPQRGKFWVYEQAIRSPYYAIFDRERRSLDVYLHHEGEYVRMEPNAAGRYSLPRLGLELGLWEGLYRGFDLLWTRFWDAATGEMLPTEEEIAAGERQLRQAEQQRAEAAEMVADDARRRLEEETERAEKERKRAEALAERLRALGQDPDAA